MANKIATFTMVRKTHMVDIRFQDRCEFFFQLWSYKSSSVDAPNKKRLNVSKV